jgi:hypothetical protein
MRLEALPDELLARCFTAAADEEDDGHPANLARVARVSPQFRRVVDGRCWRLMAQQCFPELAGVAGIADEDGAAWKALYKLCSYSPAPALLLPQVYQVQRFPGRVALARDIVAVDALLQAPGKGRRLTQTVHRRAAAGWPPHRSIVVVHCVLRAVLRAPTRKSRVPASRNPDALAAAAAWERRGTRAQRSHG